MADGAITARSLLHHIALTKKLDAPITVRLSLFDTRRLHVTAIGGVGGGALELVLADNHDFFPVGRCLCAGPDVLRTETEHRFRGGFRVPEDEEVPRG